MKIPIGEYNTKVNEDCKVFVIESLTQTTRSHQEAEGAAGMGVPLSKLFIKIHE